MISCVWRTVTEWADLTAQDPEVFEGWVDRAGPTYVRPCGAEDILNETFVFALLQVP